LQFGYNNLFLDKELQQDQAVSSANDLISPEHSSVDLHQLDTEPIDDFLEDAIGEEFKSTFREVCILDFQQIFQLVTKLFNSSSCPTTLAACLKILVELSLGSFIQADQLLLFIGTDGFMSKLHFVMICSTNELFQQAIGEFLRFFAFSFTDEFPAILPLIQNAIQVREEKFASSLMECLVEAVLHIESWPLDTEFYEFLNLLASKLADFNDLEEAKQRFHDRLTR
jgi:hypothetical protein